MPKSEWFEHEYTDRLEALPEEHRIKSVLSGEQFTDSPNNGLIKKVSAIEDIEDQLLHLHNTFVGQHKSDTGHNADQLTDYAHELLGKSKELLAYGDTRRSRLHLQRLHEAIHDFVHGTETTELSGISQEEYHDTLGKDFMNSPTYWQLKDMADIHLPNALKAWDETEKDN